LQFKLTHNSEWAGGKQYIIERALFRLWIPWHPFAEQHLTTFPFFSFRDLRFSWDDNGWTTTKEQGRHFENIKYRPTNILHWTDYSLFPILFNPRIMYTKPQLQVDTWVSMCLWFRGTLKLSTTRAECRHNTCVMEYIKEHPPSNNTKLWWTPYYISLLVECWLYIIDPLIQRT